MTTLNFDTLPDTAHMTVKDVAAMLRVSVATVWRMVERGALPQPKKFSARCTRWEAGAIRRAVGISAANDSGAAAA